MKKIISVLSVLLLITVGCSGGGGSKSPSLYSVTYEDSSSTGGSIPTDNNKYTNGQSVTIDTNSGVLVRTGYYFAGWNTETDGSGTAYAPGQTIVMGSSDIVLYSMWNNASTAVWAQTADSFSIYDISVDSSGNVYAAGYDRNSKNLLKKFNSAGALQWTKAYTVNTVAAYDAVFNSVTTDSTGNVYAAGTIESHDYTYDFGNSVTAKGTGFSKSFILVKYDTGGNALWAQTTNSGPADGSTEYNSVSSDGTYIYAAGEIDNTLINFGNSITCTGINQNGNTLLVKYDSTGKALWATTLTAASNNSSITKVSVDSDGNSYTTAEVHGTGEFDFGNSITANGTSSGYSSILVKYNTSGVAQFSKNIVDNIESISIDNSGNIYAAGSIYGTGSFDFGNSIIVNSVYSGYSTILIKYNSSGAAQWAQTITEGNNDSFFLSVKVDNTDGSVYAAGVINGINSYNFGNNISLTQSYNGNNMLLAKYNSSGVPQWAQTITDCTGGSWYHSLFVTGGKIYAAGSTGSGTSNFGNSVTAAGTGSVTVSNGGHLRIRSGISGDIIVKYNQ